MVRLRDLGATIGTLPTGSKNAITDVAGVSVGHQTVISDEPHVARTGVTIVQVRPPGKRDQLCYGGISSFNGNGEMTGSHWLAESGLMSSPIGITNTNQVGLVRDVTCRSVLSADTDNDWALPIVGETWDGWLSDINSFPLAADDVTAAIAAADTPDALAGHVEEGNVGGGTGMVCHEFKGGIGTSSRVIDVAGETVTIGALVQANYGTRSMLRLDGRPIGQLIGGDVVPVPDDSRQPDTGSIIVIIATDAPLLGDQCERLARRATVGLARVGGTGANSSGDIFLACATGNRVPARSTGRLAVTTLAASEMTPLFNAAAEAVEESIWNALCAAETMTGYLGRTVYAIPQDLIRSVL